MKKIVIQLFILISCFAFWISRSYGQIGPFDQDDPFAEMDQIQKNMESFFGQHFSVKQHFTESPKSFQITQRDDSKFKYVEISGDGVNHGDFNVDVHDGMIVISSSSKTKSSDNKEGMSSHVYSYSSSSQSIPVPDGVDESKVDFGREGDRIIIKFPRIIY